MLWKVKTLLTFKVSFPAAVWSWITFVDLIIYSNIKKSRMKIDISISAQNHDVRSPSYQTHPFINRSKNLSKCNFLWDVWHLIIFVFWRHHLMSSVQLNCFLKRLLLTLPGIIWDLFLPLVLPLSILYLPLKFFASVISMSYLA